MTQFEHKMQMLSPELQQKYIQEQQMAWDAYVVNTDIPAKYRLFALSHTTPVALDVKVEYFMWLMQQPEIKEFSLNDAVVFCRACNKSLQEWMRCFGKTETTSNEYAEYIKFCESLTATVNDAVEPISEKIFRKIQSLQRLQVNAGNRKIPLA